MEERKQPTDEIRTNEYSEGNDRPTNMTDEESVVNMLEEQGYTDDYRVEKGKLLSIHSKKTYKPKEVKIVNFYRFEGLSNPDDMSIVYAIETSDGSKGILTDAYGLYSDDETGEFLKQIEVNKKTDV